MKHNNSIFNRLDRTEKYKEIVHNMDVLLFSDI